LSGPKDIPYGPGYYAVYFNDPSGNRLEIYHRPPL
jgi:catechol-2,3-dioxygenase